MPASSIVINGPAAIYGTAPLPCDVAVPWRNAVAFHTFANGKAPPHAAHSTRGLNLHAYPDGALEIAE
jgi:hypothetical protein